MQPVNSLQARRLQELIEVLAGQRGNEDARAVTLGELRALQLRVNETVKTVTETGLGNLQGQVSGIEAEVALARAEALAANTAASAVQSNLNSEVSGLQGQIDAIILEYNGPEGAAAVAEAAAADALAAKTAADAAKVSAQTAATDALSSKNAAATSATSAAGSATAAANYATTAQTASTNASGSASSASTSAATATNAANAAGQSATAAASSASTAQTHATNAETSATAASSAKTAAETARSQAQTSASNAATSATNAASSASSAATSATTAAQSATSAGTQATAAANSATTAATKAAEASQSASSSATSATTATTQAANAANSATQAATSATNAAGSASAASTSATTAANARGDAVKIVGNFQFVFGKDGWSGSSTSETVPNGTIVTGGPTGNAALRIAGSRFTFWSRKIPVELAKQYRVRFRVRAVGDAPSVIYAGVATYDANGTLETASPGSHRYCAAVNVSLPADSVWRTYEGIITGGGNANHNQFRATTAFAAPVFVVNYLQADTVIAEIDECSIDEVTAERNAEASAAAAATSASNANASANSASQSATSASSNATSASTSAANASTSAVTASTAATNAGNSAALALSSQQLAAQITSKSTNILADQFLATEGSNNWSRWSGQGALTKVANELFSIGQTWSFDIASGNQDGIQTESTDTQWKGQANADAYAVEVDFTLVSGSLTGAGILLQWINTASASFSASAQFSNILNGPLVLGQPMTATVVLRRPSNFTGTFSRNRLYAMANWSSFGNAAKTIRFHRVSIRPATAEELGAGQVATAINAAINSEAAVRASEDGALAAQINTITASVNGLSASVSSQGAALATVEGNLAASYSFRAKAGTAGAQLELIASSDPSGTVSVARISADNILLNGTVNAPLIAAGAVTADKIAANAITSGKLVTGEAVITQSAQIELATIETANIKAGAVTNQFAAFTGADVSIGGSWVTIQSVAIECAGGPVSIEFNAGYNGSTGFAVEFLLNGGVLRQFRTASGYFLSPSSGWSGTAQGMAGMSVTGWANQFGTVSGSASGYITLNVAILNNSFSYYEMTNSLSMIAWPGAGVHTIEVRATNTSANNSSPRIRNRFLQVLELKR